MYIYIYIYDTGYRVVGVVEGVFVFIYS